MEYGEPLIQYDWCNYKKGKFRERHTERMPYEDEGRDRDDVSINERTTKIVRKPPEGK